MIQDTLYEGEITTTGTYTLNYDVSNYEYVILNYISYGSHRTAVFEKNIIGKASVLDISPGSIYSNFTISGTSIIIKSFSAGNSGLTITAILGIRKETFNTAYTGTTYKTLWNSSTDGVINSTGSYTLADDVNNYDFITITHGSKGYIRSNTYTVSSIPISTSSNKGMLAFAQGDDSAWLGFRVDGNTFIVTEATEYSVFSITGIKVNGYTLDYLAELAAPSEIYETLSLPADSTWTSYIAPANGVFKFAQYREVTSSRTEVYLSTDTTDPQENAYSTNCQGWNVLNMPVRKGQTYYLFILGIGNAMNSMNYLRFYYSVGAAKQLGLIE